MRSERRALTIVELLVTVTVIAVLIGVLLPALVIARNTSRTALCAANLRQIGVAFQMYLQDTRRFPQHTMQPDWKYGGVRFLGATNKPVLDEARPINHYLDDQAPDDSARFAPLYRCPSDSGVFERTGRSPNSARQSILPRGTCYMEFGTSYRANPFLMDSTRAGIDDLRRPLSDAEIFVDPSRLVLLGDAAWWYATRQAPDIDASYEASWHSKVDSANFAAVDGSVRFAPFRPGQSPDYELYPRPARR